jgi:glycosyltransferase involved in cell wall biosynthesis
MLLVMEELQCGGAELAFFSLCRSLSKSCEVHLALAEKSLENSSIRRLHDSLRDTSVTIHRCKTPLNAGTISLLHPFLRRAASRELASLMAAVRSDVVIVNLPTVERGQAVIDAAAQCSLQPPVWGFLHLSQKPSVIGAKLGPARDLMVPKLIRRFDHLLTVSEEGARDVVRLYGAERPQVVRPPTEMLQPLPPGVDRSHLRRVQGLPDSFLVGMVGRVQTHHKGPDVALRVVHTLLSQRYAVHLVVIGDGPDLESIRTMAGRNGMGSAVTFLGWRDDVPSLLPLLDAVLMPSRYEGLPQVAVQAVTAHVPVVGYAVGGLAELLPSAFVVPYGSEDRLAAGVASLLRKAERWPAEEVRLRALTWCAPENAAAKVLAMTAQLERR